MENSMEVPQKIKITIWSSKSTSGYILKKIESKVSKKYLYIHFRGSIIHNSQKQPKCPSMRERINEVWHIRRMECYSAFKSKGILTHATTWMNLEDIMQSEISQSQKYKYCMIPLMWDI